MFRPQSLIDLSLAARRGGQYDVIMFSADFSHAEAPAGPMLGPKTQQVCTGFQFPRCPGPSVLDVENNPCATVVFRNGLLCVKHCSEAPSQLEEKTFLSL